MVGLSIVLETQKMDSSSSSSSVDKKQYPQVINKITMAKSSHHHLPLIPNSSLSTTSFLDHCFLCKHKLLPGKDIYMYKGDRAFCSVECRCRNMFMDEEETMKRGNCSFAAMKPRSTSSSSSSSSSPSRSRRGARNRANGVAY